MEYIFNFAQDNSLFTVNLPLNQEYKPYLMDLMRMISIHLTLNIMFFIIDPEKNKLLNQAFFMSLIFILFGVSVYWLVFKKFVSFKYKKQDD
tara:strand:+ start:1455 stop:1730 length:276 start_codon:yes stop_codon:yes gene_type:complete